MDSIVTRGDYVLIAIGLLLILTYGLGLIILAVAAWRIGARWETLDLQKAENQNQSTLDLEAEEEEVGKESTTSTLNQSTEYDTSVQSPSRLSHLRFQKTYKLDEYNKKVLEDGK